jgi:hypothetical protein
MLRPPHEIEEYTVFVSSGDDLKHLRKRIKRLVESFSEQLAEGGSGVRLRAELWEDVVARRPPDGSPNALFVEMARNSHLAVVLLECEIRTGTREEIAGVMEETNTQLVVIRFQPRKCEPSDKELLRFLDKSKRRLLYNVVGSASGDDGWHALIRTLVRVIAPQVSTTKETGGYRDRY